MKIKLNKEKTIRNIIAISTTALSLSAVGGIAYGIYYSVANKRSKPPIVYPELKPHYINKITSSYSPNEDISKLFNKKQFDKIVHNIATSNDDKTINEMFLGILVFSFVSADFDNKIHLYENYYLDYLRSDRMVISAFGDVSEWTTKRFEIYDFTPNIIDGNVTFNKYNISTTNSIISPEDNWQYEVVSESKDEMIKYFSNKYNMK
ncbi:MAG: hypothetical protein ACRC4M_03060 [Mycoplasma sp.]